MMEKGLVVALELLLDTLSPELFMGSLLMGHLVNTHKKVLFLETEQSNIEQYINKNYKFWCIIYDINFNLIYLHLYSERLA